MAEMFFRVAVEGQTSPSLLKPRAIFGMTAACLFMTAGSALSGAVLYDSLALGLSSVPGLLVKSAVNIAAAALAGGALGRAGLSR